MLTLLPLTCLGADILEVIQDALLIVFMGLTIMLYVIITLSRIQVQHHRDY